MFELTQEYLDTLFPAERTDEFFEALFGDPEDGAYDIRLVLSRQEEAKIVLNYELHVREGECLACNLTSGLPLVFAKHPILAVEKTVEQIKEKMAWDSANFEIGKTNQFSSELHFIPLIITKG